MPKFTLDNSFRFGSRNETITNFHSESIEKIIKKLTKDWLGQFAREEQVQADLIGWKKILVKINEVVDDAVEKQTKEESVKRWLGKLRNLACDVDYLLDEFQTEAFQRMLLQDDDDVMSKVKVVDARMQDIASQIDPLDLRKKSAGKSRNVGRVILSAVRLGGGGRDPPGLAFSRMKIFSKSELLKATKNFHHCLGMGGFGSVYKGVLPDNTQVAVKKYMCADEIRITEWEFLGIISQVKHKNVVKILGLCLETKVSLLVYEFVSNRALSHYIHDKSSQVLKNWKTCLRIAAETASAIHYLHSLASPSIIHSDVKSTNILLDDNYTAKVSDFESLVPISSDDETAMSTMIRGTVGYLDPEYAHTGILTKKIDVYSFGVVLVELLTGMNPDSYVALASNEKISMVPYFLDSIENNSLRQILNFQVADESEMEEIEIVAELASKCLRIRGTERPTMKEVSEELDRLRRLQENYWARKNNEESEHLLERKNHCSTEKKMPEFTLGNSFHYGSQKQTISDLDSETIETLLTKMTSDRLWQFAHEEQIQDDLIGWKKMLVKINEVLHDAVEKQSKEKSVKMWLGKLQNLACNVDYLLDEFQTDAFQRKLLLDDDAVDKFDSTAMSKVKDVNARFQDIASQIDLLGLKESSVGKS
ncbi:protein kinase domain-containing protein [Citrus sinensis]|nr:protein kinase domain-containing protein [Citrus sinensis]